MFGQVQSTPQSFFPGRRLEFCIVLVSALVGVVASLWFFNGSVRQHMGEHILGFLREDAQYRRNAVDSFLHSSLAFVRTRAAFLADLPDLEGEEARRMLHIIPRNTAMESMAAVVPHALDAAGELRERLGEAMAGKEVMAYLPATRRNDKARLLFAVPIRQGLAVRGVLYALYAVERLEKDITSPSFGNDGGFCVVDENNVVILGYNMLMAVDGSSFRTVVEQRMDLPHRDASLAVLFRNMSLGRDGILRFSLGDDAYYLMYMPCREASWYVMSLAPAHSVDNLFYNVTRNAHLLALSLCLCMVFLVGYVFLLKRRRMGEERMAADRLRFIMDQSALVVLEWDMARHRMTFSEHGKKLLGLPDASCPLSEKTGGENLVHPDDLPVWRRLLRELRSGSARGVCELRLRTASGAYQWFRCNVCVLFGAGGRAAAAVGVMIDIHEDRQRMDRLSRELERDSGTGLYNKKATERRISEFLAAHDGKDGEYPLIMVDLDNLKKLNDTHGHDTGDLAIRIVAQALRAGFRESDIVGRIGGDEFLLLVASPMTVGDLHHKLDRLQRNLNAQPLPGGETLLTASIGAAFFPRHGTSFAELFRRADQAAYRAKHAGRGRHVIAE